MCCVVLCVELTCLERLPLLLLLSGFGISPLGFFVLLLSYAFASAVSTPACTYSLTCAAWTLASACQ